MERNLTSTIHSAAEFCNQLTKLTDNIAKAAVFLTFLFLSQSFFFYSENMWCLFKYDQSRFVDCGSSYSDRNDKRYASMGPESRAWPSVGEFLPLF